MRTLSQACRRGGLLIALAAMACAPAFLPAGCRSSSQGDAGEHVAPADPLREQWGIEVTAIRLSAAGHMVDFRYKVLDPDKAAELADPEARPCMIDQASGTKLPVPKTPKIGPLRQTAQRPEAGRVYFVLFANLGGVVKPGSKVTVVLGDFRAEGLEVE